ncbi:MAG: hypothetical protein EOP86_04895 [Verrucomicrobiaceae bacterium]|nr:MAG: hypothetical protein EOP86_04895 [Verrucomicrobiaceae bacterium]
MSWILCTVALAESLMGPGELDAIRLHLGEDYRATVLDSVTATVRGYCAARGELGEAGTIPPECLQPLGSLYRQRLIAALPVDHLMTETRQAETRDAWTYLRDVGAGRVGITRPSPIATGPEQLSTGPVSPSICAPRRQRDRRSLDGS